MFKSNLKKGIKGLVAFAILGLINSTIAHAVAIDPAHIGLHFWDNGVTRPGTGQAGDDSFKVMFGNPFNNNPQLINFSLTVNEVEGSATALISGLNGRIFDDIAFRADSPSLGAVTGDISFTWNNLFRDANGNLVGRTPVGGGTLSLYSNYFDGGSLLVSLSPKGSTNSIDFGYQASPTNPLFFFLGDKPPTYQFYVGQLFAAWFMADQSVNVNGNNFTLLGDFHGQADIPEPASMLLLGSSLLLAPLRRKLKA